MFSLKGRLFLHMLSPLIRWLPQVKDIFPECQAFSRPVLFLGAGKETRKRKAKEGQNKKRDETRWLWDRQRMYWENSPRFFLPLLLAYLCNEDAMLSYNKCKISLSFRQLFLSHSLPVFSPLAWENLSLRSCNKRNPASTPDVSSIKTNDCLENLKVRYSTKGLQRHHKYGAVMAHVYSFP